MTSARMVGYLGTDRDRVDCAFHALRDVLRAAPGAGYGVAHYTDDALLLNRRPNVAIAEHPFAEFLGGVKTRTLLAHAYPPAAAPVQARDLHPFKFRTWALALSGELAPACERNELVRAGLLQGVPDFIARDVKGQSWHEALFYNLLGRLHAVQQLDVRQANAGSVATAIRAAVDQVASLCSDADHGKLRINLLATDGQSLYALRRGGLVMHTLREGITECDLCYQGGASENFALRESHQQFRAVFVAIDLAAPLAGWKPVEESGLLVVSSDLSFKVL